ncbi:formate/nitrite transporter family protein [Halorussus sp. AFM4]|uniref:formate/nitrite transporter family protein n=1 Tax=Halorussus sp. AFM4 TaxID=3421651 RepID=UPI003EB718D5
MSSDTDPSPTSYREILGLEIEEGLSQLQRSSVGLALSGLSAGLDIGFGPFLMAVVFTMSSGAFSDPVTGILVANAYAVGFIFVVVGRSELFTEHTSLAVVPVLNGQASVVDLARLWGIIYVFNLIGGTIFAALAVHIGPQLATIDPSAFRQIASGLVHYSWSTMLLAAVLAGWLMGLMTWLVAAGRNTISQAFFVWLVAVVIGLAHLPHSIAGSVEVLLGVFSSSAITVSDFGHFLLWSTIGNVVGGSVFVGLLKYGHGIYGGTDPEDIDVDVDGGSAGRESG